MNNIYGNYNIKVGDILIAIENLMDAPSFTEGTKFMVWKIEDDYLYVHSKTSGYSNFHIESQNAERCSLTTKENRENKLKDLLDEA